MQADSEKLRQAWIKAVQNSIATAFRDKGDDGEVKKKNTQSDGFDGCDDYSNEYSAQERLIENKENVFLFHDLFAPLLDIPNLH